MAESSQALQLSSAAFLGLQAVYEPRPEVEPSVDIVAIHGIGAHGERTWAARNGVNWLKDPDMLPELLPTARILQFSYESTWLGAESIDQRCSLIADQLLYCLSAARTEYQKRPIVFIAHCFGGIVVEKALIAAKLHEGEHQDILESTAGIVFLGTPHRGSKSQSWAKLVGSFASEFGLGNPGIFDYIESNSAVLRDQVHDFSLVANRANIPIFCFFEQHATNIARILLPKSWSMMQYKTLIVDEVSGCIDGFPKLGLAIDHMQMNKFQGNDDHNYLLVSAQVVKMAQEGNPRVKARLNPRRIVNDNQYVTDERDQRFLQALFITNPPDDKENIESRKDELLESTYAWLLKNEKFCHWLNIDANSTLWLHGDPGKGKTMLSIGLINEITHKIETTPGNQEILGYFFCDRQDDGRNTTVSLLRGLLYQILCQQPKIVRPLREEYNLRSGDFFSSPHAALVLWRWLYQSIAFSSLTTAYIIVDGLDECDEESIGTFLGFLQRIKRTDCRLKWILTSRNEFSIQQRLPPCLEVSLEDYATSVNEAVLEYINVKVNCLATQKRYSPALRDFVEETLMKSAEGTFLWVALACHELGSTYTRSINTKKVLAALPIGLALIYERMLVQILSNPDAELKDFAVNILRCVTTALRPLTLKELALVAGLPLEHHEDQEYLKEYTDQCGSFLTVRNNVATGHPTVYFVHQSAQEFLVNAPSGSILTLDMQSEHSKMATFCLDYLCSDPSLDGLQKGLPVEGFEELFTSYATHFWMQHAKLAKENIDHLIQPNHPFFSTYSPARSLWESRFQPKVESAPLVRPLTRLHLGAYAGIKSLVRKALEWESKTAFKDGSGQNALLQAAIEGHKDIVEFLISEGVSTESNYRWSLSSLQAASLRENNKMMVEMLINHGADVNAVNGGMGTSLQAAVAAGNIEVARLLLDRGADVNKRAGRFGNALRLAGRSGHTEISELLMERSAPDSIEPASLIWGLSDAVYRGNVALVQKFIDNGVLRAPEENIAGVMLAAARSGHPECLQLLLENGAPPASRFDDYHPPLLEAARAGDTKSALLLLEHGAPANVDTSYVFNKTLTPLLAAVTEGHEEVAETLLNHGADPDCVDAEGRSPILTAASSGRARIVHLLLENGANVNKKDCEGRTASELALKENHRSIFRHLIENGGTYDAKWVALNCSTDVKIILSSTEDELAEEDRKAAERSEAGRGEREHEEVERREREWRGYDSEYVSDYGSEYDSKYENEYEYED